MSGSGLDSVFLMSLAGVVGLLMTLVLLSLWRSYPGTVRGLACWSAASALLGLAVLLLAARGRLPATASALPGNLLLLAGAGLLHLGTERFLDAPSSLRRGLWGLAAAGLLLVWFSGVQPHDGARVVVTALAIGTLAAAAAALLLRQGHASWPTWLMAALWLTWAGVALLRALMFWDLDAMSLAVAAPWPSTGALIEATLLLLLLLGTVLLAGHRLRRELAYLARHDALTQALTRHAFVKTCELELDRCRRHHRDMALLLLDIDHFKSINEASGHRVGDEVILDFVARVYGVLRRSDQVGRYGGEKFAVLLPETGPQEALAVAERIRSRVATLHLSLPSYTVSVGATVNLPGEDGIDTLVKRVETGLRQAKTRGRNRVVFV